jgi:catalase (peroxidase I)
MIVLVNWQDASGTLMMLPTDLALVKDEAFLPYVQKYAKNKSEFYADFATAFQKLEELGTSGLAPVSYS